MEQKRTLWIIAAAGMFLLVVLSGAFIFYSPSPRTTSSVAKTSTTQNSGWTNAPSSFENYGNVATAPLPPPPAEIHSNELTVYSDRTVVYDMEKGKDAGTTIDLNSLRAPVEQPPQNINITVNVPETKQEEPKVVQTVEINPPAPKVEPRKAPAKTEVASAPKPAPVEKKVSPAPAATTAPAKKTATAEVKVAEKQTSQYWVQAAAYSSKKIAENARTVLDDNKISADIFTYQDAKGKVFYRVRVGPYTTKSEAEYWRTRIVKIDEFAKSDSYITVN